MDMCNNRTIPALDVLEIWGLIYQLCEHVVSSENHAYTCFCALNGIFHVLLMREDVFLHTPDYAYTRTPNDRKV